MRRVGRFLGRAVLVLALICCGLYVFGPYEDDDLNTAFEPRKFGEGVQVYFESTESAFDDITPGTEKRVICGTGSRNSARRIQLFTCMVFLPVRKKSGLFLTIWRRRWMPIWSSHGWPVTDVQVMRWLMPLCRHGCMTLPRRWPQGVLSVKR
jgi:hypothetical protein